MPHEVLTDYEAEVERLRAECEALRKSNESFELASATACADADRAESRADQAEARVRELEKKLKWHEERRFPIQDGPSVRWSLMAPHETQAVRNHGQTLKRLAERGGLGVHEALCVVHSQEWFKSRFRHLSQEDALREWNAWILADERRIYEP